MEKFIEGLVGVVKPPWNYLLGIAALLIVVVPRFMELRHNLLDARMGRRQLELQKLRLEVLKLRIDVQQLAKQEQFPELTREFEAVTVSAPSIVAPPPPAPEHRGRLRGFVARHPRLGRPVMLFAQIVLAYLTTMLAVATVAFPVVGWTDPELGPSLSIFLAIVYAAFAWLSYKGFTVTHSIRKEPAAR